MDKMKKYPKYKDSGIEWIGDIPEHWNVMPFKRLFKILYRYPTYYNIDYVNSGIPEIRGEALNNDGTISNLKDQRYIAEATNALYPLTILEKNDIVMSVRGTMGKVGLVDDKYIGANITANLLRMNPIKDIVHSRYLIIVLLSKYFKEKLDQYSPKTTIKTITIPELNQIPMFLPPKVEQEEIANYLDQKTKQIDTLIEKKQKLIDLLKEQRTAIINQAVTKGLDPNVPMKDSGIEWLGRIPEHWEVKPLKFIKSKDKYAFVDGPFGSNLKSIHFIANGDVYVIESGFITSGEFKIKEFKTITREHFETIKRSECKAGDIIIAKIGANFGMSGILPELDKDAVVSGNSLKLTVDADKNLKEFIHFQLLSLKFQGAFDLLVNMTAQPALSLQALNSLLGGNFHRNMQEKIVTYLNEKLKCIDKSIASIKKQIELQKEYRTTLISEVVTGKIDVRNEKE